MLAATLLIGVVYTLVNILIDLVHGWLDPRLLGAAAEHADPEEIRPRPAGVGSGLIIVLAVVFIALFGTVAGAASRRRHRPRTCCSG